MAGKYRMGKAESVKEKGISERNNDAASAGTRIESNISADFWTYSEVVMWPGLKKLQQLEPEKNNNSARVCSDRNIASVL